MVAITEATLPGSGNSRRRVRRPRNPPSKRMSPQARFNTFVRRTSACWTWQGFTDKDGYGTFKVSGKSVRAHRFAFELTNGAVPLGLSVLHLCDNPSCVRSDHLYVGTQRDNVRDRDSRGRQRNQYQDATHCIHGHPLSGSNLRINKTSGQRVCVECHRRWSREWLARKRQVA